MYQELDKLSRPESLNGRYDESKLIAELRQKAGDLEDRLANKHEFFATLTTALHYEPLTDKQWDLISDGDIELEDLDFLYNVKEVRCKSFLSIWVGHFHSCNLTSDNNLRSTPGWANPSAGKYELEGSAANTLIINNNEDSSVNGIIVGTGSTAVALADGALDTLIASGNSSGQLEYSGTSISTLKRSTSETSYRISRSFFNGSGGTITINEVGLLMGINISSPAIAQMLVERTLNTLSLPDGAHAMIAYKLKTRL